MIAMLAAALTAPLDGAQVASGQCTECLKHNCCPAAGLKCEADGHDGSCTTCTGQYESPCGDDCCKSGQECHGGSCTIPSAPAPVSPPEVPRAPFKDCGSTAFDVTAAYFEQTSSNTMINGFDAAATREFTNATFSVSVSYAGQPFEHHFDACTGAAPGDGFPPCPWQRGTKLHIMDHNPAFYKGDLAWESTWTMIDSLNNTLFCMKTNWTLHP
jgi:hypothetical protein